MHCSLKRGGFSLIEVILVSVLLSIAFMVFLGGLANSKKAGAQSNVRTVQAIILNDLQEQIRSRRYDQSTDSPWSTLLGPDMASNHYLSFDGSNDYINNSNLSGFNFSNSNEITIEAWFKLLGHSGYDGIVSMNSNGIKYRIMVNPGMQPYYDAGMHQDVGVSGFTFSLNTWYHYVMVVRGGGNAEIYVNGTLVSDRPTNVPSVLPNVSQILIGTGEGPGIHPSNALIDDCRVWNVALSQDDIQAYMVSSPPATTPGLVGYWDFNEGEGNLVNDLSGNGNSSTIYGSTWVLDGNAYEQNLEEFNDIDDFDGYIVTDIDNHPGFGLSVEVDYVNMHDKFRVVSNTQTDYKRVITTVSHGGSSPIVDTLIVGAGIE